MKTGLIDTVTGIGGSRAMAVDSKGNLFTAAGRGLRMRDASGKAIFLEDRSATPPLNGVKHIWADRDDNILIADASNHLIRKFNVTERKLVTLAGNGSKGADGVPGRRSWHNSANRTASSLIREPATSTSPIHATIVYYGSSSLTKSPS